MGGLINGWVDGWINKWMGRCLNGWIKHQNTGKTVIKLVFSYYLRKLISEQH